VKKQKNSIARKEEQNKIHVATSKQTNVGTKNNKVVFKRRGGEGGWRGEGGQDNNMVKHQQTKLYKPLSLLLAA
jgi:hypothetical protein